MPISTKKGDKGFTGLLGGRRVPKYHLRPETYGTLDELNSFLGMARAVSRDKKVKKILFAIQNHFFIIGSELALSGKDRSLLKGEITQKEVDWLSHQAGFTGEGGARVPSHYFPPPLNLFGLKLVIDNH
jgi:cob(I)alamin adenosyltransferase